MFIQFNFRPNTQFPVTLALGGLTLRAEHYRAFFEASEFFAEQQTMHERNFSFRYGVLLSLSVSVACGARTGLDTFDWDTAAGGGISVGGQGASGGGTSVGGAGTSGGGLNLDRLTLGLGHSCALLSDGTAKPD